MLIVEMARGQLGQPGFSTFELKSNSWNALLALATHFGWEAQGTECDESVSTSSDLLDKFTLDYKVKSWNKRVSDDDALALSNALFQALDALSSSEFVQQDQVLIVEGMSAADFERINRSAYDSLSMFAQFTANGGFSFAWDD